VPSSLGAINSTCDAINSALELNPSEAEIIYAQCATQYELSGDKFRQGQILYYKGGINALEGNFDSAEKELKLASELLESFFPAWGANAHGRLATIYSDRAKANIDPIKNFLQARKHIERALELLEDNSDPKK